MERRKHVSIVVCGHLDAGKSTTIGRFLYELGCISERELQKLRDEADRLGKGSFAFAFYTDRLKIERERGVTINCTMKEFLTKSYHYTIIDVPGHRDFIKNMISGASQADVALIMAPADETFENSIARGNYTTALKMGQTRQHALLLNVMGVKQIIVGVNKMDCPLASYREEHFNKIRDEMIVILKRVGFKKEFVEKSVLFLPMSGWKGDNLLIPSKDMPWWKGMEVEVPENGIKNIVTLYDALENMVFPPKRALNKPMRTPIYALYKIRGIGDVLTGRIEQGTFKPGDEVVFLPSHTPYKPCMGKIFSIETHHKSLSEANAGDNVGFNVKGLDRNNMPRAGNIMIHKHDITITNCKEFICMVQVINHPKELKVGYSPIAYVRTGRSQVRMNKINWVYRKDDTKGELVKVPDPISISTNNTAEVVFEPKQPFVVDSFNNSEGFGRVVLMDGNMIVMVGKVIKIVTGREKVEGAIYEMLCVTKYHLSKDIRGLVAQLILKINKEQEKKGS